ncbi:MAG: (2Fe-2S)-binding protein [Bacteroidetes bacterium]|nr:MAG: (2Fe-2S)-binding protein [Bacteroidota bacterium]
MKINFTINGKGRAKEIKASTLLIDLIRDGLKLKGTKPGCFEGECGACTVLVDGHAINSCLYLAVNVAGKSITTIEGLGGEDQFLDIVQEKLIEHGGVQCGFCTSGMAMSIKSYSDKCKEEGKVPNRNEVAKSLEGNLCRCTGYVKIVDAAISVCGN